MRPEEQIARDLFDVLSALAEERSDVQVAVSGAGVHYQVDVVGLGRTCRVHCFHYGPELEGLVLGMRGNTHLNKGRLGRPRPPLSGAEYLIKFGEPGKPSFEGRDREPEVVRAAIRDWIVQRMSIDALYARYSFVDAARRALGAIADRVDAHLAKVGSEFRCTLEEPISPELWVYGDGRSCELVSLGESVGCAFRLDRAELARAELTREGAASAVAAWLHDDLSLTELVCRTSSIEVAPYADLYERGDISEWHWANVLDQARGSDSVLAGFLPILERIVESPALSRFFSFTSLNRLCFSSSSHYPFADGGLPLLQRADAGSGEPRFMIQSDRDRTIGTTDETCAALEAALRAAPITPFHGTYDDTLIAPINQALREQNSPLFARRAQRCQWFDVVVEAGERRCVLSMIGWPGRVGISFRERERVGTVDVDGLQTVVHALGLWLEDGVPSSVLAANLPKFVPHGYQPRSP